MWLIVPKKLQKWSKIAVVSLSWWWPSLFKYRYDVWIKQFKEAFWVEIIEMPNALKNPDYIYKNPQKRANDLMNAFLNPDIDWIISTIWWDDSIRILPYIDFNIIKNNPKIFMWYSDSSITNFIIYKAWVRSYYWPAIMSWFAENWGLFDYMIKSVNKTLFTNQIIWEIEPNTAWWTCQFLDWWNPENQNIKRHLNINTWWRFIQWDWIINWELLWWCIDILPFMFGTEIWPDKKEWKWKILFIETSEEDISEENFKKIIRTMGIQWILQNLNWIIMWRAKDEKNYDLSLLKIIAWEFWLKTLPIITNMDFWHTDPMFVIPIWAKMKLDFINKKVFINECWVL